MAKMERLKVDETTYKAFATLTATTTKTTLEKVYNAVKEVENVSSEDIDMTEM